MSKKFLPVATQIHTPPARWMSWGQMPQLPLDHDAVMYPRVSTPKQQGNVSSEMQLEEDGKLMQIALQCGWKPQQIRCPKDDMALSGRLKMEERSAFRQMLGYIHSGEVKAVIAVEVDRLFRDKFGAECGKFMEICEQYGVLVVCPDMVYDFHDMYSITRFRDRCVAAWEYMEYQIYRKMLGARDFLGGTCRYASGCTPVGYIVDQRQKLAKGALNPTYRKYVVYEPHARIVLAIFRRFRELNGRLWQLHRKLLRPPFVFPDFEEWVAADGFLANVKPRYNKQGERTGQYLYSFVTSMKHASKRDVKHMLLTTEVDGIFWKRLIAHLEQVKDFEAFAYTEEEQKVEQTVQRNEILTQIEACERAMQKLLKRLTQLEEEGKEERPETDEEDKELITYIRKEFRKFSADKKRQEERLRLLDEEKSSYASQMITYRELILEVREYISEYTIVEERQEIGEIFATKVTLDTLSPRVYKMTITWRDTTWGIDQIIAVRKGHPSTWWTPESDKLLQEHYATATRQELMRIFPDRPVSAIYRRASMLGIKKTKEDRESGRLAIAEDLSLMDYTVMEQYGLCWRSNQEDEARQSLEYTCCSNGGEHGVYFVCSCGRSGLFIVNEAG